MPEPAVRSHTTARSSPAGPSKSTRFVSITVACCVAFATDHVSRRHAAVGGLHRGGMAYRRHVDDNERRRPESLPSKPSAGQVIGGILAGIEHLVTGRPRPAAQIEEQYREPWATADGITVEGLDEPVERREPPDRSGARL